jgi:hypothetical protein
VRKCYLSVGKEVESMRNSEMDGLAAATWLWWMKMVFIARAMFQGN